jgi:hypothetical protein
VPWQYLDGPHDDGYDVFGDGTILVLTLPTAVRARTTQEIVTYVTGSVAEEDGLYGDDARAAIRPAMSAR